MLTPCCGKSLRIIEVIQRVKRAYVEFRRTDSDGGDQLVVARIHHKTGESPIQPEGIPSWPALTNPAHLRPDAAEWWLSVHQEFNLGEHHSSLLTMACETWDRCPQAREILSTDGIILGTLLSVKHEVTRAPSG